jgi:hypothetical protein
MKTMLYDMAVKTMNILSFHHIHRFRMAGVVAVKTVRIPLGFSPFHRRRSAHVLGCAK